MKGLVVVVVAVFAMAFVANATGTAIGEVSLLVVGPPHVAPATSSMFKIVDINDSRPMQCR